jgi:hypothetical protein
VEQRYRLRVRDETGNTNFTYNETTVAPFGS